MGFFGLFGGKEAPSTTEERFKEETGREEALAEERERQQQDSLKENRQGGEETIDTSSLETKQE